MGNARPAVVMVGPKRCNGTGLGAVRTLGRAGVPVISLLEAPGQCVAHSRYSRFSVVAPSMEEDALVETLLKLSKRLQEPAALFATNDRQALLLAKHGDLLEGKYLWHRSPLKAVQSFTDKSLSEGLTRELSIRTPATMTVNGEADLEVLMATVPGPWVAKPTGHHLIKQGKLTETSMGNYLKVKAMLLETPEALREVVRQSGAVEEPMLVQEYVPGGDDHMYVVTAYIRPDADSPVAVAQKIRQYPPGFGFGCHTVSLPDWRNDEGLAEAAYASVAMARHAGLSGLCDFDWKRHSGNSLYYFIECNPRINQLNLLLAKSGLNLILWAYMELVEGRLTEPPAPVRERRYFFWDELVDPRSYAIHHPGRGPWWLSYFHHLGKPREGAFLALDDPLPGLVALSQDAIGTLLRKLRRRRERPC